MVLSVTMHQKFIFVTGGVVSSLGKGLTCGALAAILEGRGLSVALMKLDPYLNVDPGTMNPYQHGEVYVTDDGSETDLDLGHYHRFSSSHLSCVSNATTGQIYDTILKQERRGDFLGNTVQVIPHITDEIKKRIAACARESKAEVILVEIGGTVGDIESLPFMEAIRQYQFENAANCMNIHLTYVPYLKAAGEVKTKPTQHSVAALRQLGISPDIIICRCEESLSSDLKDKIALFCNVSRGAIFDEPDLQTTIYELPLQLRDEGVDVSIAKALNLPPKKSSLHAWEELMKHFQHAKHELTIGIVGKYVDHQDAYKSILEALTHAAIHTETKLQLKLFDSEKGEISPSQLKSCDGILVPGGFGERGFEGKVKTAKYCRENYVPYFGICLGMQVMMVEYARNVLEMKGANSTEMDPDTDFPIISLLSEQKGIEEMGGTMRLGAYTCKLLPESKAHAAYQSKTITERHRHRYEFNNAYKKDFEDKSMCISGTLEKNSLCEIAEIKTHPWMVGVQFHPEFLSKPTKPHPLFVDFFKAAHQRKNNSHG